MKWIFLLVPAAFLLGLFLYMRFRKHHNIYPGLHTLLYENGKFVRMLEPGRYSYFDMSESVRIVSIPAYPMPLANYKVSVISKDQFAFRLSISVIIQVDAAQEFLEKNGAITGYSQPYGFPDLPMAFSVINAALIDLYALRTISDIVTKPAEGLETLHPILESAIAAAKIDRILITEVNFPPEVRKMFTEVERARREAQAALERARGEQASLRALANAARMLDQNPNLAELRKLHAMETAKGAKTFVFGTPAVDHAVSQPAKK
jgi:regulator of protease activity HflC (stomatin/prohibitin superfamily)